MRNDQHAGPDMDYTAYLVRIGCGTVEEAFEDLDPRESNSDRDKPRRYTPPTQATDYFVFFQDNGRWAWRRVSQSKAVVAASNGSFRYYLHCVADARKRGWKGRPLSLFYASGFAIYS